MNNLNLEKQIIELIPSQTIKEVIKKTNHKFTDIEYVQLVEEFSISWHSKLELLNQIKENTDNNNLIAYIEAYVKSEINAYHKFISTEDNYVYDVIMDYISNYDDERFLCSSFDSVMKTISNYKKYIDDSDLKHIKIVKRKISKWDTLEEIDKNENMVIHLNNKIEINCIYHDDYIDIEDYNLSIKSIKYPTIFKAGDLVYYDKNKYNLHSPEYKNYYYSISNDKVYGLVGFNQNEIDNEGDIDECYFLNLSNEFVYFRSIGINEQQYVNCLEYHGHIDFGYIEKAKMSEVHQQIKDDYEYTKSKLLELGIIK